MTVFYSGHGVPGLKDKRGYLLPVNANPDTPEINGYPVDVLYKNLASAGGGIGHGLSGRLFFRRKRPAAC